MIFFVYTHVCNSFFSVAALAHIPSFKSGKIEYSLPWEEGSDEAERLTDPLQEIWWSKYCVKNVYCGRRANLERTEEIRDV